MLVGLFVREEYKIVGMCTMSAGNQFAGGERRGEGFILFLVLDKRGDVQEIPNPPA